MIKKPSLSPLFNIRGYPPLSLSLSSASRIIDSSTSLREGDIAVSTGRRSKTCFAKSCQWAKSVDGHVYIAYRIAPQYSES